MRTPRTMTAKSAWTMRMGKINAEVNAIFG
jgi:hypothetical protein